MINSVRRITFPRLVLIALILAAIIIYTFNIPIYTVESHGEISDQYNSIQELNDSADLVVLAEVGSTKGFKYKEVPFTLSLMSISKVIKGEKKQNDTIQVLETGGIINNVEYTFEETKALKKQDKAVLYLKKYVGPIVSGDAYVVLGVFQGKFKVSETGEVIGSSKHLSDNLKKIKTLKDLNL
ncbi:hypothetical protein PAESOLCIP111_04854 [Paenibacillus solanacearum]|uniref:Uncharacterized protein n=1 Tax=Paenibacillus solanacearum TaxID=2048548 RepID=A0A916K8J6_9BACL|nr:hypothetical protein [Paenibacillus solanacearum]CAG7645000.1 hypothetical protein PAESOLCIP111_04854 [Paenibacillus solanacearum]